jgi:hypothetical protein
MHSISCKEMSNEEITALFEEYAPPKGNQTMTGQQFEEMLTTF